MVMKSRIAELFVVGSSRATLVAGGLLVKTAGNHTEMEAKGKEESLQAKRLSNGQRSPRKVCLLGELLRKTEAK